MYRYLPLFANCFRLWYIIFEANKNRQNTTTLCTDCYGISVHIKKTKNMLRCRFLRRVSSLSTIFLKQLSKLTTIYFTFYCRRFFSSPFCCHKKKVEATWWRCEQGEQRSRTGGGDWWWIYISKKQMFYGHISWNFWK